VRRLARQGFQPHLGSAGVVEQADAVAEEDRRDEHEDLVEQAGLDALPDWPKPV
jgi:hypothetical protein